ncbi:hypothetical protein VC83_01090 [Pseudogymnoascus destructans]|uniref:Uncharacterized protein n=1 Tax=Pseudogymnoascus destructans TaxID=655981 RepID=A0A177AJP6_9PEZI|nr:uncharacterized protein VC83_01090 [Pseudogymnoascus destructans]OAF62278.1 hypothetical protein VC83_01090 [Pseudogymnoascus destructans]
MMHTYPPPPSPLKAMRRNPTSNPSPPPLASDGDSTNPQRQEGSGDKSPPLRSRPRQQEINNSNNSWTNVEVPASDTARLIRGRGWGPGGGCVLEHLHIPSFGRCLEILWWL